MSDDPESVLVAELRALAPAPPEGGGDFTVPMRDVKVRVRYVSGSSSSLTLSVVYDVASARFAGTGGGYRGGAARSLVATRPLGIHLRREKDEDVDAKRRGIADEWQSGDPAFDRRVYVETPTTDPAVLGAVVNSEVRQATLALFDLGFQQVEIDTDGSVHARMDEFSRAGGPREGRGRPAVEAFALLASNLPPVKHSGAAHAPVPFQTMTHLLLAYGGLGWLTNIGYGGAVIIGFQTLFPPRPGATEHPNDLELTVAIAIGIAVGLVASSAYAELVHSRARGRSDAVRVILRARVAAFAGVSVFAFTVSLIAVMLAHR
jgi:hypothetical protein